MKYMVSALVLCVCGAIANAQNRQQVTLLDGSRLKGVFVEEKIEIVTKYGTLVVPWKEVKSVQLGIHYPEGTEKKVKDTIILLGSEGFKERDEATRQLVAMGRLSYALVSQAMNHPDIEVGRRATGIRTKIEEILPDVVHILDYDTLFSKEGVLKGKLTKKTLKFRTAHLGELDLPIHSIAKFSISGEGKFNLDSANYGLRENVAWFNTNIDVEPGEKLLVTAAGQIDLWAQAPGQYMSSPNGYTTVWGAYPAGALIGKIGEHGPEFKIGENYSTNPGQGGRLYLRINGSPWIGAGSTGVYEVTVTTGD